MEYQKKKSLWDNIPSQSCKLRTENWVKTNNDQRGMLSTNSQIKFKTSMLE